MLRDENIDLRERIIDVETDYVILNDSFRNFITVSAVWRGSIKEQLVKIKKVHVCNAQE